MIYFYLYSILFLSSSDDLPKNVKAYQCNLKNIVNLRF